MLSHTGGCSHCFYYPITVHQANDVFISSDPYWVAVWPLSGRFVYFHFLSDYFSFLRMAVWLYNRQIWCCDCNRAVFEQMLSSRLLKYYQQSSTTKVRSFPLMSSVVFLVPLQSNIKGPLCVSCFKLWVRQLLTTQVAPKTNTHPCTIYFPSVYALVCLYVCLHCFRWPRQSWRGWRAATDRLWEMRLRLRGSTRRQIKVRNPGGTYFSNQDRFQIDGWL